MIALAARLARHPFIRFGMVGLVGFTVDTALLAFDTEVLGFGPLTGKALSIFIAMGCTWLGNRYLTFADRRAHGGPAIMREWMKFVGANSLGAVINYGVFAAVVSFAPPPFNDKYVGQVCGVLVGMGFNFTLSRKLVFKGAM